ncbi:carboxypeptidase-like regulatory domain-containing protein [Tamlana sp. 2201CG12-4]|uniref:carboxypeptidase-like regulatory domain-containing protein n=1 Tax=Tamlana sp. 2201CG12-4 TaxID=3112582 RepID=UPI002DC04C40|nr:carboxypeptidase-like regulatory domain-containing protein [Tamlana sp. 2201CG12-4]MEC3906548.1 carboxypeptidase-like regulatory domain-containing protein [Tamlana sp. 2201CG12-4]
MIIIFRNVVFGCLMFFLCVHLSVAQQKNIELNGLIVDESNYPVPYAAIGIPSKYIGTASTDEGSFYLLLSKENLSDSLEVSSIGYKSFKVKVEDFINKKEHTIVLIEEIVSLDEVQILKPAGYLKNAIKNLKNNTVSAKHELNMLYRRFSVEHGKARFFTEHYLNILDRGPNAMELDRIEVVEGRKSADYRFVKTKQNVHAVSIMAKQNPIRRGVPIKNYKWSKIGDTSYDGEDVVIIEGRKGKNQYLRLYIGIDTYSVFKIETSALNAVYIYKKDKNGKLYLSYHNREWISKKPINDLQRRLLEVDSKAIKVSYRHEMFVLGLQTDKRKIKVKDFGGYGNDMGDVEVRYNPDFWNSFSLPPETAFYKKSVKELESIYGIPLETQFKLVNK